MGPPSTARRRCRQAPSRERARVGQATARRGRDLGEQREQLAPGSRVCRVVPAVLALARVEGAVVAGGSRGWRPGLIRVGGRLLYTHTTIALGVDDECLR